MTRSIVVYLGWRLLTALLLNVLLIVAGIRLMYVDTPLTLYQSDDRLYDVPTGVYKDIQPDFMAHSGCEVYRSTANTPRYNDNPSQANALPPDWLTLTEQQTFTGYSPQKGFFTVRNYLNNEVNIWDVANQREIAAIVTPYHESWWSADERYVIHLGAGVQPRTLTVIDMETNGQITTPLPVDGYGSLSIKWSPYNDYFVYQHFADQGRLVGGVGTPRGEIVVLPRDIFSHYYTFDGSEIQWVAGDTAVRYWTGSDDSGFELLAFNFVSGVTTPLHTVQKRPSQISADGTMQAVFTSHAGGSYSIDVLDIPTNTTTPFIAHADDLGDPYPHPDGTWLSATFDAHPGAEREIRVAWMRPDGSDYGEYGNAAYEDIRHLEWATAEDSSRLSFVGVRSDGTYDLLVVDVATGAAQTIIMQAHDLLLKGDGQKYHVPDAYAYTDATGQWYLLRVDASFDAVYLLETPTYIHRLDRVESPDGQGYALMLHGEHPYRALALAQSGDTPTIIMNGLTQYGTPSWSPNGQYVRVLRAAGSNHMSHTLFLDRDGNAVNRLDFIQRGEWIRCD